jgi:hypothetical protein
MHFMGQSKIAQAAKLSRLFCRREETPSNKYEDRNRTPKRYGPYGAGCRQGFGREGNSLLARLVGDHSHPLESYTTSTSATATPATAAAAATPTTSTEAHFHPP